MNRLKVFAVSLIAVLSVAAVASAKYKPTVKADVGIYPNDFGPTTIDVSHYPPKMKLYYKVFSQKCQACHTIARPINSQFLELTDAEMAAAKKNAAGNLQGWTQYHQGGAQNLEPLRAPDDVQAGMPGRQRREKNLGIFGF